MWSVVKPLLQLSALILLVSGCDDGLFEPGPMSLEVSVRDVEELRASFAVRVLNWDGAAELHYQASACSPSGDIFICMGGPFFEKTVTAERVLQPISWTSEQCGFMVVFEASLPNGEKQEITHITCE